MTREEAIAIIRKEYLCVNRDCDIERSCGKCDLMMPSKEPILKAYKMAIQALEQEPCEDEYIKVPKKALKYRTAGMVAYNAEWLKNNFDIERAVIFGVQKPCDDAISRQAVLDYIHRILNQGTGKKKSFEFIQKYVEKLPPVNLQEPKWDRLYSWLNDMRFGIAPDETVTDIDERHVRTAQVDMLDEIMEWMIEPQERSDK